MNITINGQEVVIEQDELSLVDLLKIQEVESPDMVSVQLNGEIIEREVFNATKIKTGDTVEFLYFMGGGAFSEEQIKRYSRHILLKNVGGTGQKRLLESRVLVVGLGGLGSPSALYLAAAGVGHLGLVDSDRVDLSNLQRQVIHFTPDLDRLKVDSAKEKIAKINPDVSVTTYTERLAADNIMDIIADYDIIVEGTDNFPTKFLVNDACILSDKPCVQGGILHFQGQAMTHIPESASYRCAYRKPPPPGTVPTCSESGVLGAVAGMLGTIQAAEALKYLLGIGDLLINRLLFFDAFTMNFRTVPIKKTDYANRAADNLRIVKLIDYEQEACAVLSLG